jgi:hypothetical protein
MPFRDSSVWLGHRSIHAGCWSAVADEVHATGREGFGLDRYNLVVNRMLDSGNVCANENNRYLKRSFVLCKLYFYLFRCSILVVNLSRIHYLHNLSNKPKTQVTYYSKAYDRGEGTHFLA